LVSRPLTRFLNRETNYVRKRIWVSALAHVCMFTGIQFWPRVYISIPPLTLPTSRALLDSNTGWFNDGRSSILPRYRGLSYLILHDDIFHNMQPRYQSADMDILLLMNPTLLTPNRVPRFEINSAEHSRRFVVEIRKQTLCYEEWLKPIALHLISHSLPDKQRATNCITSTQAINTSTFFHQNFTLIISPFQECTTQTKSLFNQDQNRKINASKQFSAQTTSEPQSRLTSCLQNFEHDERNFGHSRKRRLVVCG
jgi:hypothetical protein